MWSVVVLKRHGVRLPFVHDPSSPAPVCVLKLFGLGDPQATGSSPGNVSAQCDT